jgi:hypothetical protein
MKHLDTFSKRVLIIGMVMVAVLLSGSVFFFSVNRLHATGNAPVAPHYPALPMEGSGKYMVSASHSLTSDNRMVCFAVLLNTENGASKSFYSSDAGDWKEMEDLPNAY